MRDIPLCVSGNSKFYEIKSKNLGMLEQEMFSTALYFKISKNASQRIKTDHNIGIGPLL